MISCLPRLQARGCSTNWAAFRKKSKDRGDWLSHIALIISCGRSCDTAALVVLRKINILLLSRFLGVLFRTKQRFLSPKSSLKNALS